MATILAGDPEADPLLLQHQPDAPCAHQRRRCTAAHRRARRRGAAVGGELLLLTTDGVHGVLDAERMSQLAEQDDDPRVIAENLIAAAPRARHARQLQAVVAQYV